MAPLGAWVPGGGRSRAQELPRAPQCVHQDVLRVRGREAAAPADRRPAQHPTRPATSPKPQGSLGHMAGRRGHRPDAVHVPLGLGPVLTMSKLPQLHEDNTHAGRRIK